MTSKRKKNNKNKNKNEKSIEKNAKIKRMQAG